jgi:hypothetical protein
LAIAAPEAQDVAEIVSIRLDDLGKRSLLALEAEIPGDRVIGMVKIVFIKEPLFVVRV